MSIATDWPSFATPKLRPPTSASAIALPGGVTASPTITTSESATPGPAVAATIALPGATPVTSPVLDTVATFGVPLFQLASEGDSCFPASHARRRRRIHPLGLAELELVQEHADLQTLEQAQGPEIRQVGGDELRQPARQGLHARIPRDHQRQHRHRGGLGRLQGELCLARQRLPRRPLRRGAERELRLGAHRGYTPGGGVLRRKIIVGGDRFVVAGGLLLTPADHERPEHIVRLGLERRACHDGRAVAAPSGGERRCEPKGRDWSGLWYASAGDSRAQQQRQDLQLHRRDFFFAAFFLASTLGLAAWAGFGLDLRTSTSASTRSPSSGPIKPRRTA